MVSDEELARHYRLQGVRARYGLVLQEVQSVFDDGAEVRVRACSRGRCGW